MTDIAWSVPEGFLCECHVSNLANMCLRCLESVSQGTNILNSTEDKVVNKWDIKINITFSAIDVPWNQSRVRLK